MKADKIKQIKVKDCAGTKGLFIQNISQKKRERP
jgi:hypothetical protein